MANFPPPSNAITHRRLPSPWGPRWAYMPDGRIPTWTQSRVAQDDPDAILPSSYQTHLLCLLYNEDSTRRWFLRNPTELRQGANQILAECGAEQRFEGCAESFGLVMSGKERESPAAEEKAKAWGRWL
eukprot:409923-Pyramimonas_sp.AAC.1